MLAKHQTTWGNGQDVRELTLELECRPKNRFALRQHWSEKGLCFLEQSLQAVLLQRFGTA